MEILLAVVIVASFLFLYFFEWTLIFAQSVFLGFWFFLLIMGGSESPVGFYLWLVWYVISFCSAYLKEQEKASENTTNNKNLQIEERDINNIHDNSHSLHNVYSFQPANTRRDNVGNEENE